MALTPAMQIEGETFGTPKVIGTLDGHTVYSKVIDFGALPNAATYKEVDSGLSNSNVVLNLYGVYVNGTGTVFPLPNQLDSDYKVEFGIYNNKIRIATYRDRSQFSAYVTIEYY